MNVLQTIAVAFSMFSNIPMPQFPWTEKNMRYSLVAFPLIGGVIGGVCYLVWLGANALGLPQVLVGLLLCSLPFWLTGGIHLDGFMDTMDAVSSHKSREEKLEILKDPHIGSFAVCHVAFLLLWNAGIWQLLTQLDLRYLVLLFMFSRSLSGLAVCRFPMAKNTGLAHAFASEAIKGKAAGMLFGIALILSLNFCFYGPVGMGAVAWGWGMFGIYYVFAKRIFGGITGDLAGWFLTLTETLLLLWYAVAQGYGWMA